MATIVSTTDFRTRLGAMFDLADKGEQILIKRRYKPSYRLTPVDIAEDVDDDDFFTPEMLAEIDRRYEACMAGTAKLTTCRTDTDLETFLASL
jgi:antitoxin (DNA-binding transcriptional repressor) of toxin-antitoxin stability system